ncbi:type II secretion system protein N [Pseudomonas vancouverensis]|uniref:type II secretion system protein N n=1 Tax=Pseudomonas vancouverensis TaxID=95300 RepID=UPI003D0848CB
MPRERINADAIATVLGLSANAELLQSAEPLVLHASLVVSNGPSKALIADAQGARIYQAGEALPGGSVLRRIEPDQVVLWSKGREEVLSLKPASTTYLPRAESRIGAQATTAPARFLRSYSGPSE